MAKKVFFAFLFLLFGVGGVSAVSAAVDYSGIIESESNWIASLQEPSGAIVMTRDHTDTFNNVVSYKVEPYFANLAVIGMLDNPSRQNLKVAKNWIRWYINHLNTPDYNNVNGTIYVYYLDAATKTNDVSSGQYDSTDSYAATFMTMIEKYVNSGGDRKFIKTYKNQIKSVADAMLSTMGTDGLTLAKPDYAIKYLMDNSEVYEGLRSAVWFADEFMNDANLVNHYNTKRALNLTGIETLWSSSTNNYRVYEGVVPGNWSIFYPDATAQVFPIWNGVIAPNSQRAIDLSGTLNLYHPGWPYLNTADDFPWAILAYSAAVMGDKNRVDTFLQNVKSEYIDQEHPWVWYNMEAGFTIRAAKTIRDATNLALGKEADASSNPPGHEKLTDGDLNGFWTGSARHEDWASVDLGTSKTVNRVVLKWDIDFAKGYQVLVSNDGVNFTQVSNITNGDGGTDDISFAEVSARYVGIELTDSEGTVELREFEVYNESYTAPPNPAQNLALNAAATASSNNGSAGSSVDGNSATRWSSATSDNEWFQIDLGSSKAINKVVVDWEAAYDSVYSVQTSVDGTNYMSVYTTSASDGGKDTIRFGTHNARYVKLLLTTRATPYGSSFWEVEVYNDTSNPDHFPNLALNKTTTASSSTGNTNLSVDGNLATRWSSDPNDNEWYKIDLGASKEFNKVVIDWEAAYDSAFSVQVSTDDITYTTVYSTTTGTGGTNAIVFPLTNARYVKLLLTTRATGYGSSFWEAGVYQDVSNVVVSPNLALNKTVSASTNTEIAPRSVDGDLFSRWGSEALDNQWYLIDLGSAQDVNRVQIDWETAYASEYSIQLSTDGVNYTTAYTTTNGQGGSEKITFTTASARYVKVLLTTRGTIWGSSFWEIGVYKV